MFIALINIGMNIKLILIKSIEFRYLMLKKEPPLRKGSDVGFK